MRCKWCDQEIVPREWMFAHDILMEGDLGRYADGKRLFDTTGNYGSTECPSAPVEEISGRGGVFLYPVHRHHPVPPTGYEVYAVLKNLERLEIELR